MFPRNRVIKYWTHHSPDYALRDKHIYSSNSSQGTKQKWTNWDTYLFDPTWSGIKKGQKIFTTGNLTPVNKMHNRMREQPTTMIAPAPAQQPAPVPQQAAPVVATQPIQQYQPVPEKMAHRVTTNPWS